MPREELARPLDLNEIHMEGVRLRVPPGWEGRMRKSAVDEGGSAHPVTHAATVPLLPTRGDYGSGVVEQLGPTDLFVSLVEFGPEAAGTALFAEVNEFPRSIDPRRLQPNQLQRLIPGQAGAQTFFTYRGRPFCLYVVVGSVARRADLAARATEVLDALEITP